MRLSALPASSPAVAERYRLFALGMFGWMSWLLGAATVVAQPAAVVEVSAAEAGGVNEVLVLTGSLGAERSAGLSPRADGLVRAVKVDAGDRVEAGQLLIELDDGLERLALARAEAALNLAEASEAEARRRVDEALPLVAGRSLPKTELDARRAALAQASASRLGALATERELREQVERHRLIAPFAGVIAARSAEAGEWVTRGTPVLQLVALDSIRLDVQVPQERFDELDGDVPVLIEPDMHPGRQLPARISARVPVGGGAGSRTFLLRLVAEAGELALLPGTSARARFTLTGDGSVRISRDALLRHADGGYSVFVAAGEPPTAERRPLRLGREADGQVEVLEGLAAGERVVVRGNETLREGQPLSIAATRGRGGRSTD